MGNPYVGTSGVSFKPSATEISSNKDASIINSMYSNIGGDNPAKGYPSPRSLFYDGAKLDPVYKQAEKNGLFMFYSFGAGEGYNFLDQYYLSERSEYNTRISSIKSKNPTAGQLVKDSITLQGLGNTIKSNDYNIVGGIHAPYDWKDFIYCKYYGTVPNNRMITLRRFSSPVLDNLSVPKSLQTPENLEKGVGTPVAQAVTWFGGKTGNSLSSLINFSTGLAWKTQLIDKERVQKAFGDRLLNSTPYEQLMKLIKTASPEASALKDKLDKDLSPEGTEALLNATNASGDKLSEARFNRAFFDAAKNDTEGRLGLLSEKIWVPVDVIKETSLRAIGLDFTWENLVLKFSYDLTSAGEVNTKAAMFDILGNLLSIGTNYGNFLTPHISYDSEFSALGFPGGSEGIAQYYTNLNGFITENFNDIMIGGDDDSSLTVGSNGLESTDLEKLLNELKALGEDLKDGTLNDPGNDVYKKLLQGIQSQNSTTAASEWQAPLALYTGAPVGEWHVVIGNPYNPIAMIGNLLCSDVKISFSETLGPDDFPSTLDAQITLQHGRPRERGEIESIFNRGDGRLYQSVQNTTSNAQTYNTIVDLNGAVLTQNSFPDNSINPTVLKTDPSTPGQ